MQENAENLKKSRQYLNFTIMKKSTLIIGYLVTCIFLLGAIFKMQHWPGAGPLILFGCLGFSFAYAIPLYLEKRKLTVDSYSKFIAMWVMIIMVFIPVAILFKVQHWPGAGLFVKITYPLIALSIPLLIAHAVKSKETLKNLNFHNEAIVAIFLFAFIIITFTANISKQVLDAFVPVDHTIMKTIKLQETKCNNLYTTIENVVAGNEAGIVFLEKAKKVKSESDSLCDFITSIGKKMVSLTGQEDWNSDALELVMAKSSTNAPDELMIIDQFGIALKQKLISYKEKMDQNTNNQGKEISALFFNTDDPKPGKDGITSTWESEKFEHLPMISVLVELNQMKSNIRMLEAETLVYLQAAANNALNDKPVAVEGKNKK